MINGKSVLAVIPARAGSKGLPRKNFREICGKSLVDWAIYKAQLSVHIDNVVLSTDDLDAQRQAIASGIDAPFLRPDYLAIDEATSVDVILHALDFYQFNQGVTFDYVLLIEPTSPLRKDDDFDRMLAKLDSHAGSFDAIISVGQTAQNPSIMKRLIGQQVVRFCPDVPATTRRQDDEPAFFPFGVAYIVKTETLRREKTFYPEKTTWFEIERFQEFEIDDFLDLICVERIMQNEWSL